MHFFALVQREIISALITSSISFLLPRRVPDESMKKRLGDDGDEEEEEEKTFPLSSFRCMHKEIKSKSPTCGKSVFAAGRDQKDVNESIEPCFLFSFFLSVSLLLLSLQRWTLPSVFVVEQMTAAFADPTI